MYFLDHIERYLFAPVIKIMRSSAAFALLYQGISGVIQLEAFISLKGDDYLAFSNAFVTGTVLSIVAILNFENKILAGKFSVGVRHYFSLFLSVGFIFTLIGLASGASSPNFIVFCCWGVCVRIFLAWAATEEVEMLRLLISGLLVLFVLLLGNLHYLMASSFISMLLCAPAILSRPISINHNFLTELGSSASEFRRYLPHTMSGLLLGYFDRFLALNFIGGVEAETYLRTLQICSWAAFCCYPLVFQFRNSVLSKRKLQTRGILKMAVSLAALMISSVLCIFILLYLLDRLPILEISVVSICVFAVVLSQIYQATSTLNFVGQRFSLINKITLSSAGVCLVFGVLLVVYLPSSVSLAVIYLTGWCLQTLLTIQSLREFTLEDESVLLL